jgi:hypothetical protein
MQHAYICIYTCILGSKDEHVMYGIWRNWSFYVATPMLSIPIFFTIAR